MERWNGRWNDSWVLWEFLCNSGVGGGINGMGGTGRRLLATTTFAATAAIKDRILQ